MYFVWVAYYYILVDSIHTKDIHILSKFSNKEVERRGMKSNGCCNAILIGLEIMLGEKG